MSRHPIFAHNDGQGGISLAGGRTNNVQSALGGTVPGLDGRLLGAASPQSFHDIWSSGPVPAKMPLTMVKGHAKRHDLKHVHQWRSALSLHTNARSKKTIFSCGYSIFNNRRPSCDRCYLPLFLNP
jgi:hypothetical protein